MNVEVDAPTGAAARRWLVGLRRAWVVSGALDRWVEDRGITGVVYTPATYEIDDCGDALAKLVEAGARPDQSLLWDLVVEDAREAASDVRSVYDDRDSLDGYVAMWLDPARSNDPDKAVKAAAEIISDVRRANVAIALAWTPGRAAVVETFVAQDCPVALSGVRDQAARDAVVAARRKGMDRRRAELTKDDPEREVPEVLVFLLGGDDAGDGVFGVQLVGEFDLISEGSSTARVPVSPDAEISGVNTAIDRLAQRAKLPAHEDTYTPLGFRQAVLTESKELDEDEVLEDVWLHDHTIWKDDPTEIADRLGWLDVPERMAGELKEIAEFARKARASCDAKHVVLLGMGGSSLAAETFSSVGGSVPLTVLDTTHPGHIEAVRSSLDLERTLFVVASKSGSTIETRAHLEYFWSLVPRGDRFVAITDPGSDLAKVASDRGFLRTFENPPDIGGRYSALSYFGLVPAALCGIELEPIVNSARRAITRNSPGAHAPDAPGTRLAAALFQAFKKGSQDKLTLVMSPRLGTFGSWIEQLVAESTGKEGTGVLPVVGEPLGAPEVYGNDRVFCVYTVGDETVPSEFDAFEDAPVIRIHVPSEKALGAEMYRWQMATAILGYSLDINPFDQPDVESAKKRALEALSTAGSARPPDGDAKDLLEGLAPPSYLAIQAFVAPNEENRKLLQAAQAALRDKYNVAVTVGFGPRYLHSTGQLHKGGASSGVFLQVTDDRGTDIAVPGDLGTGDLTFGRLIDAQADGDLLALREAGRSAARVSLPLIQEIT